jgi:RHS repeat-associated protein
MLSLVVTSCGQPTTPAHDELIEPTPQVQKNESHQVGDNYIPPVFDHPEPIMGDRDQINNPMSQNDDDLIFPSTIPGSDPGIKGDDTIIPSFNYPQLLETQTLPDPRKMPGAADNGRNAYSENYLSDVVVAEGENIQVSPSIEYNIFLDETLIIWADLSTSPASIWGRRLTPSGNPIEEAFFIVNSQINNPQRTMVVHNSLDGTYLLLWVEENGGTYIYGTNPVQYLSKYNLYLQPLSDTGTPTSSSPTLITDTLTWFGQSTSWYDIVHNENANEYLLVWREPPGGRRYTGSGYYYLSPHHVVGEKFNAEGERIGQPVTLTQYADTDVNIGYDSINNKYVLTFTRYGDSYCSFVYGCSYFNYLILYSQVFTSLLVPAEYEYYLGDYSPMVRPIGGFTGHILSADMTHLQEDNTFLVIYWDNTAYQPNFRADIYAVKISTVDIYPIGQRVKLFSNVGDNRTSGEFNPSANQTFVLAGLDDLDGIDGMFLNNELASSVPYPFTNNTLEWKMTAVDRELDPGWLTTWSASNDIYVRSVSMYTGLFNGLYANSILNGNCGTGGDACQPQVNASATILGPINTSTGGLSYHVEDMSTNTSAGPLNFLRTYSSLAIDLYSTDIGYGWTHNFDTRLIFADDPGGETGYVLFKEHTANLYQFYDLGNNTFSPVPGILGELTYTNGNYILTLPNQSTYTFASDGKLQTWSNAQGNTWEYGYDSEGLLEQVSADEGARFLALAYDGQGRIISVTDHTERSVAFDYDENGDLISMTDVMGEVWEYEYDSEHRLTKALDPLGNAIEETEYDEQGRAIKQWDGEGNLLGTLVYNTDGTTTILDPFDHTQTHTYDSRLTLVSDEDGAGGAIQKTYDPNFRPVTITDAGDATTTLTWSADGVNLLGVVDAAGGQTDITYDSLNNPTAIIDPLGYLTTYEYDGTLLTGITNALDQEITYTYTEEGFLESVTDPLGNTTSHTYNSHGQRTSMTDALENTWTYAYDNLGRLVETTDPLGRVTRSEYDAAGRLIRSVRNYDSEKDQNEENLWNIVTEYEYDARGNQISVTDTYGRATFYEYDAAGRLVRSTDSAGGETTQTYNEAGQLIATTDALGNETNYEYDEAGRLTATSDALGNTTTTVYNLDGTVASTSDALGRATSYTYDDLKRVVTVTQPNGAVTTHVYDAAGNLTSVTDTLGNVTEYEYDALGRVIKTTDALGNFTENFYDDAGRLVQTIDARGHATTYEYDDAGRQVSVTDALGNVTSYEYDSLGRRVAVIDAMDNRTEYTYDELDRVIMVTDPLGNTIHTEYDALGQVTRRTDANGNETAFEYNDLGQTLSQTDTLGNVTFFDYDAAGNRLSTTDARGSVTSVLYDELNRPIVTIDPLGYSSTTTYDPAGQVAASTNANDETTSFTYTVLGQQETITDALGNVTAYNYDPLGRVIRVTDANEIVTAFEYDALGRLTAVIENYRAGFEPDHEINVRTEYTYDENGNRLSITDGNGNITEFTYDELNRLLTETDPLGNEWSYEYNALGNRVAMTDANGATTFYAYDEASRLVEIDYADDNDVSFEYDPGGRRTQMTDSVGITTWDYDELNRPTGITDPFGETVTYIYDQAGNRTRMLYAGKDVQYAYDAANRLTQVNDWTKNTFYEYDPLGRISAILRPNGVDSTYSYDAAGRLTQLLHGTAEHELASYQYAYDDTGNRIQAVERVKTAGAGATVHLTVADTNGALMAGIEVYVFDGETYTTYHATTDANGQVAITLPQGSYRFRIDVDGTQYWSDTQNHCTIGECDNLLMTVTAPTLVFVADSSGTPQVDIPVYAFMDGQYTGYHGTTDEEGILFLRLSQGDYDLRADFNDTQFWGDYLCDVPSCWGVSITVNQPVIVTVLDTTDTPQAGVEVYAFEGTVYTGKHATTDENGQVYLSLPNGEYRFRADFNPAGGTGGTQFWSGEEGHCAVPGCWEAGIVISLPLVVTVLNTDEEPQENVSVYAFDGGTYTNFHATTDANGEATFTLPQGNYRFRADFNGTQFWSGTENHCEVPGCEHASITVTNGLLVTVSDTDETPKAGLPVYVFNGTTYTGFNATTDINGQVTFTLPAGNYRFRADLNGTQFWSGTENHCEVPGCGNASITVTNPLTVTVSDTDETPKSGLPVYVFSGTTYTGKNATTNVNGEVTFTLPLGNYRFRADLNGTQFWSGASNHCEVPGCSNAEVTVSIPLTINVQSADETPQAGVNVYAFNGTTYTGYNRTTDTNGQATFTLPLGNYRFRADYSGTQYWSDTENHCEVPGCLELTVVVGEQESASLTPSPLPQGEGGHGHLVVFQPKPSLVPPNDVTVRVSDVNEEAKEGLTVYVFDSDPSTGSGQAYTGLNGVTDENGQVTLTLPDGNYRFRADYGGTQFWSSEQNHCEVPNCESAEILVSLPLTVTVTDTDETPQTGLRVYVFDGDPSTGSGQAYTGYHQITDENGQAVFTLPFGEYRFRTDVNGTQFWSGEENHCDPNDGCESVEIVVNKPILIQVLDENNTPYPDLPVYVFDDETYTGFNSTTDENGNALFTLPTGNYRFRTDLRGTHYWSDTENHCEMPGCEYESITIPGGIDYHEITIDYTYDPLNRLTGAYYSNSVMYEYEYDAVGNRVYQYQQIDEMTTDINYYYDSANRLIEVDSVEYTWDDNGNLLSDGVNEYIYDSANRLIYTYRPGEWGWGAEYTYNGLGDRLTQTAPVYPGSSYWETTYYTLDLNSSLTQVLKASIEEGSIITYTYGLGRISQHNLENATPEYFLGDALGSVRQMTDQAGALTFAQSYDPYGTVTYTDGESHTEYGFTGEQYGDTTELVYLRARYYSPNDGRFQSRDTWSGDVNRPLSLNRWNYAYSNPANYVDSTGHYPHLPRRCNDNTNSRVNLAMMYVSNIDGDEINTYTAGGIGVQCYGTDLKDPRKIGDWRNSGEGPAQISDNQKDTPYGERIGTGENPRGWGLRCWIQENAGLDDSCECLTEKEMKQKYGDDFKDKFELEPKHNQHEAKWAVTYMQRRIQMVVDQCKNCNDVDTFIVSALAQNGPGFNVDTMNHVVNKNYRIGNDIDWIRWYDYGVTSPKAKAEYPHQLRIFHRVITGLKNHGYYLPSGLNLADSDILYLLSK